MINQYSFPIPPILGLEDLVLKTMDLILKALLTVIEIVMTGIAMAMFGILGELFIRPTREFLLFEPPSSELQYLEPVWNTSFMIFTGVFTLVGLLYFLGYELRPENEEFDINRFFERSLIAWLVILICSPYVASLTRGWTGEDYGIDLYSGIVLVVNEVIAVILPDHYYVTFIEKGIGGFAGGVEALVTIGGAAIILAFIGMVKVLAVFLLLMFFFIILGVRVMLIYGVYALLPFLLALWIADITFLKYGKIVVDAIIKVTAVLLFLGVVVAFILGTSGAIAGQASPDSNEQQLGFVDEDSKFSTINRPGNELANTGSNDTGGAASSQDQSGIDEVVVPANELSPGVEIKVGEQFGTVDETFQENNNAQSIVVIRFSNGNIREMDATKPVRVTDNAEELPRLETSDLEGQSGQLQSEEELKVNTAGAFLQVFAWFAGIFLSVTILTSGLGFFISSRGASQSKSEVRKRLRSDQQTQRKGPMGTYVPGRARPRTTLGDEGGDGNGGGLLGGFLGGSGADGSNVTPGQDAGSNTPSVRAGGGSTKAPDQQSEGFFENDRGDTVRFDPARTIPASRSVTNEGSDIPVNDPEVVKEPSGDAPDEIGWDDELDGDAPDDVTARGGVGPTVMDQMYTDVDPDISRQEFENQVLGTFNEMDGLVDEYQASRFVGVDEGIERVSSLAEIDEGMADVKFDARITGVNDLQTFDKENGGEGKLIKVRGEDPSGTVEMTFWGDQAEAISDGELKRGEEIRVTGSVAEFDGAAQVEVEDAHKDTIGLGERNWVPERIDEIRKGTRDGQDAYIQGKVVSIGDKIEVNKDNWEGTIRSAVVAGETGHIKTTLYDDKSEQIDQSALGANIGVLGTVSADGATRTIKVGNAEDIHSLDSEINPDLSTTDPINDLTPGDRADIGAVVKRKESEVLNFDDGEATLQKITLEDESGEIMLKRWGDKDPTDEDSIRVGDQVIVTNASVQENEYSGQTEVELGDNSYIGTVNTDTQSSQQARTGMTQGSDTSQERTRSATGTTTRTTSDIGQNRSSVDSWWEKAKADSFYQTEGGVSTWANHDKYNVVEREPLGRPGGRRSSAMYRETLEDENGEQVTAYTTDYEELQDVEGWDEHTANAVAHNQIAGHIVQDKMGGDAPPIHYDAESKTVRQMDVGADKDVWRLDQLDDAPDTVVNNISKQDFYDTMSGAVVGGNVDTSPENVYVDEEGDLGVMDYDHYCTPIDDAHILEKVTKGVQTSAQQLAMYSDDFDFNTRKHHSKVVKRASDKAKQAKEKGITQQISNDVASVDEEIDNSMARGPAIEQNIENLASHQQQEDTIHQDFPNTSEEI